MSLLGVVYKRVDCLDLIMKTEWDESAARLDKKLLIAKGTNRKYWIDANTFQLHCLDKFLQYIAE